MFRDLILEKARKIVYASCIILTLSSGLYNRSSLLHPHNGSLVRKTKISVIDLFSCEEE
jgi:hypothetical protein